MAVGKTGFAAVHVVVTVGDGLMDWFLKFSKVINSLGTFVTR